MDHSEPLLPLQPALPGAAEIDFQRRFGGLARLYGAEGLARLTRAHVCVIGVGGVGSWVVEALARSAVGTLTLIDLDHVAESNINRQVHANDHTLGAAKIGAMAERIAAINPLCVVHQVDEFIDPENVAALVPPGRFDYVIDAIDNVKAKVALIVHCRDQGIPLLTIGAAGGQMDPTRVRIDDLAFTEHEPLLARVRKRLRKAHGFSRNLKQRFGIAAVYSDEPLRYPDEVNGVCAIDGSNAVDGDDDMEPAAVAAGTAASDAADAPAATPGVTGLNCAGFGSVVAVTGVFGFVAAGHVLRVLALPSPAPVSSAASAPSR